MGDDSTDIRYLYLDCFAKDFLGKCKFLIDTGAQFSVTKFSLIPDELDIMTSETYDISGIVSTASNLQTIGYCWLLVKVGESLIKQKFHVIDDAMLNLEADAILGNDFLQSNKIVIDFCKNSISMNTDTTPYDPTVDNVGKQYSSYDAIGSYIRSIIVPILTILSLEENINPSKKFFDCTCYGCTLLNITAGHINDKENLIFDKLLQKMETVDPSTQIILQKLPSILIEEFGSMKCKKVENFF